MHHEHHGDCCAAPEEYHREHLALPIGQLCCAGACNHAEHQGLAAVEAAQLFASIDATMLPSSKKKSKHTKDKLKMLGAHDLDASASIIGGMAVGLSQ